jgi:hypothetical protein
MMPGNFALRDRNTVTDNNIVKAFKTQGCNAKFTHPILWPPERERATK